MASNQPLVSCSDCDSDQENLDGMELARFSASEESRKQFEKLRVHVWLEEREHVCFALKECIRLVWTVYLQIQVLLSMLKVTKLPLLTSSYIKI